MVKAADDLGLLDLIDPEIRAEVVELKSLALQVTLLHFCFYCLFNILLNRSLLKE